MLVVRCGVIHNLAENSSQFVSLEVFSSELRNERIERYDTVRYCLCHDRGRSAGSMTKSYSQVGAGAGVRRGCQECRGTRVCSDDLLVL